MTMQRWRGLKALVQDAVVQASHAIERVQKETARRPFAVLSHISPIAEAARSVQLIHDVTVAGVHGTIRVVTGAVGKVLDVALDAIDGHGDKDGP